MKRFILILLNALLLVTYACTEKPSKAVQALRKDIESFETKIQETEDCDELQMFTFSILGLRTDLEKLNQDETVKEAEILELTNAIDLLDASLTGKYAALDCNQAAGDDSELDVFGDDAYEDYNIL